MCKLYTFSRPSQSRQTPVLYNEVSPGNSQSQFVIMCGTSCCSIAMGGASLMSKRGPRCSHIPGRTRSSSSLPFVNVFYGVWGEDPWTRTRLDTTRNDWMYYQVQMCVHFWWVGHFDRLGQHVQVTPPLLSPFIQTPPSAMADSGGFQRFPLKPPLAGIGKFTLVSLQAVLNPPQKKKKN